MFAGLIAFTLSCQLPSSTPIELELAGPTLRTCEQALQERPPLDPLKWRSDVECHKERNRTVCKPYTARPVDYYSSWQAYCDAQTKRPCSYTYMTDLLHQKHWIGN